MTRTTTTTPAARRAGSPVGVEWDAWDDDPTRDGDEPGPSWTKAYVSGVKTRQYGELALGAVVRN